jgi:hypothetical protein
MHISYSCIINRASAMRVTVDILYLELMLYCNKNTLANEMRGIEEIQFLGGRFKTISPWL